MGATDENTQELLFPLSENIEVPTRDTVPLLDDAKYSDYRVAVATLVENWLEGDIGDGQPTDPEEKQMILEVNRQINGTVSRPMDDNIQGIYDSLVKIKVHSHLRNTTSHRHWLQKTLDFCKIIGLSFTDNMTSLIKRHDMSKYTHREVVGYAVMFGDGRVGFRPLEDEKEKNEWQITLNNHYAANPHHPEYFGLPAKGERQTHSMVDLHGENSEDFLIESIIDMLASHGERDLKNDPKFSIRKWMEINPRYLIRYEENDRKQVEEISKKWLQQALDYISDEEKRDGLKNLFGDREVTE